MKNFGWAAVALAIITPACCAENTPVLLDPKPIKAAAVKADGKWRVTTTFAADLKSPTKFQIAAPSSAPKPVTEVKPGLQHVEVTADVASTPPTVVYLSSDPPFGVPLPLRVERPDELDAMLELAAAASMLAVALGTAFAGKSIWTDIGSQTFTFKSWATNVSVGVGVLGLIVAVIPGSDSPYAPLSAILGAIAGIAPIAYNFSTRDIGGVQKGKVFAFGIGAAFTGISSLGLIEIAYVVLSRGSLALPPISLGILRTIVAAVWVAMAVYLGRSTRDAIISETRATAAQAAATATLAGGPLHAARVIGSSIPAL